MERARFDPMALVYHELRAPLGLVATAARAAAEDAPDAELRSRCEVIVRTAERMLRTAEAVTRAASGIEEDSSGAAFLPAAVVGDLVTTLRGLGVPLELSLPVDCLPPVMGSAARFEALVHSMVTNAIDHGKPGVPVSLSVMPGSGGVVVEVRNAVADRDTHCGAGLGAIIVNALARGLGATVSTAASEDEHIARLVLPSRVRRSRPRGAASRVSA